MATRKAAEQLLQLADGASYRDFDAYMILTASTSKEVRQLIPAVVHHDGTARVQFVRKENNSLMYAYLTAMAP